MCNRIKKCKTIRYSKDYINMNACISESGCVCELILPGSVSLLVVKLLDLVEKLNLSVSKLFYREITEQC